jgi:GT2 family glycosyltransferase
LLERTTEVASGQLERDAAHDDILLICVNYLKPGETQRFVLSALDLTLQSSLRLAVVDNSPPPGTGGVPDSIKRDPRVRAIAPGENLGYFGGAAAALNDHLKTHSMPEWVIVSNPDVYFPDRGVLQRLFDSHRNDPPAVVAPSIRTKGSSVEQNPYMRVRPGRLRMHVYRWIFSAYPIDVMYQGLSWIKHRTMEAASQERPAVPASSTEKIYAPLGAFIAFHRSYFERGGTFDHGAFLFGEEIFVAETARKLGMTVLYDPTLVIEHTKRSTGAGLFNRATSRYRKQASRYLARTFF